MSQVIYKGFRAGFPFLIPEKAQDGLPVEIWDGATYQAGPSKSDTDQIDVVGSGTQYPVGLTFVEAIKHFWRVKSYKCTVAGDGVDAGDHAATLLALPTDVNYTSITKEHHLVVAKNDSFRFYAEVGFISSVRIGGSFYLRSEENLYYPKFSIYLNDSRLFSDGWSTVKPEGFISPAGSGSFCGKSFPIYPGFDYSDSDPPLAPPSITITPDKYWTYGGD